MKQKLYYSIFVAVILIVTSFIVECIGYLALHNLNKSDNLRDIFPDRILRLREVLKGSKNVLPRYVGAVNLNFMPTPNYQISNFLQHNSDGYRGEKVNMLHGNKYRILFLGGSTTYSSGVLNPNKTYPAQTIKFLNQLLDSGMIQMKDFNGFEGINAGLEGGRSCDELNAYLHKFRYYKPNLIILHSVGNDAEIDFNNSFSYTPDEVNFRLTETYLVYRYPIPRIFFRSYFISYLVIRYDLLKKLNHDQPNMSNTNYYFCNWYPDIVRKEISNDYMKSPAITNISTLIREALYDSSHIMLMTFAVNKLSEECIKRPYYIKNLDGLNNALKKLAMKYNVGIINYNYTDIPSKHWIDDCHLDETGDSIKGKFVANNVVNYLKEKKIITIK
ncbi:MAG: hypothetical protein NZM35_00470 [Chitinophagales bacterium]|nr:hypothetical protein [Chitinophagales bacterium]MDW8417791.1 hypothetical protein [Chitinophagales bacterium]